MADYMDLEIDLNRWIGKIYTVELRFSDPTSEAGISPVSGLAQFPFEKLRAKAVDPVAYGKLLTDCLFETAVVKEAFVRARTQAETQRMPLRVRFFIGPSATELHNLRWETLRIPDRPSASLLTNENILFSRYLTSLDWKPIHLRTEAALKALVVIANPSQLAEGKIRPGGQQLMPVDVQGELTRVQAGLGDIPVKALASGGKATLDNLMAELRINELRSDTDEPHESHSGYDILYMVCHGTLNEADEPQLWLEEDQGRADVVAGSELVTRLSELKHEQRPRLIVFASCQSAGAGEDFVVAGSSALAAIGPQLAEAGIPAVLAMQGNITMNTVAEFMPVFFSELQRDGLIDRAMAVARGAVRDRPDYWVPVLIMRLRRGCIWYVPGFTVSDGNQPGFEKWPSLLGNISYGACTPILGSGLLEPFIGSRRELAKRWAETYHYPMEPYGREDLPQVAQYVAVIQQPIQPRLDLANYVRLELLKRYGDKLPASIDTTKLDQVVAAVGAYRRSSAPVEPYKVLAGMPFTIYLTTTPDNLLAEALTEAGKSPQVELCRWNKDILHWPRSIYEKDPDYQPTVERPLVYHLFGHMSLLESIVLKEDDYFDFLVSVTNNRELIHDQVRRALADTSLLFVGFRLDDWDFRALFRSLLATLEGREARKSHYANIAAQIDPEEGLDLDPNRARDYLQKYFTKADISIYWGTVEDFVTELQSYWNKYLRQQRGVR